VSWVPPRPVRRAVLDPFWLPIVFALQLLLIAVLVPAALLAPFTRRRRVLRAALLASAYLWLDLTLLAAGLWLWLRNPLPGRRDEVRWRQRHARLLGWALGTLMVTARRLFGYQVEVIGREPDLHTDRPLVVLARHAGPGDSFTLVHLLVTRYHRCPRVVLKRVLQWDPGLDVVLSRLRCYFLPSNSGAGEDRAAAVAALVDELGPADALLLFPEGGNWTPRRHRRSVLRLLRAGRFERARTVRDRAHVLPPRPGGASAALSTRADTEVLVVAHTGLDVLVNPRQMWAALPLRDRPMRIRAWLHPVASVPRHSDAVPAWLDAQWAQVDEWIGTQRRREAS